MKANGSRLFRGLVLYTVVFNLSALCCYLFDELLWFFAPLEAARLESYFEGAVSVTACLVSLISAWMYYSLQNREYDIFGAAADITCVAYKRPQSLTGVVFARGKRMAPDMLCLLIAATVFFQGTALLADRILEYILNLFGLTAAYAPAALADNTASPLLLLYSCIAAPAVEEIVYRGFILKGLLPAGRNFAIIVSAVLFGLMHGDISQTLFTFLMGLLLGFVAAEYSIWWAVFIHFFNNGILSFILGLIWIRLPGACAYMVIISLYVIAGAFTACYAAVHSKSIARYLSDGGGIAGKGIMLLNFWFIIFVFFEAAETLSTITILP